MLAITGGKGGCGKTTTALGLGRALAARGAEPLVVDADSDMPDLHHLAAIPREPGIDTLADSTLDSVVRSPDRFPGINLLTAGSRRRIGSALQRAAEWPGPVLVDCPPGTGPETVRPLRHVEAALVVSTDQPACLDDTRRTVETLGEVGLPCPGIAVVSRFGEAGSTTIEGCPVLGISPSVQSPLSDPRVERTWKRVAGVVGGWARAHAGAGTEQPLSRQRREDRFPSRKAAQNRVFSETEKRGGIFNGG